MFGRVLVCASACTLAVGAAVGSAAAAPRTFATSIVTAAVPPNAVGEDAGVDVRGGRFVRLTAGGAIALRAYGACPRSVGPDGCAAAIAFARLVAGAPAGVLVAAFTDAAGRPVTAWAAVGRAAYLTVPADAVRLVLRTDGTTGHEPGAFRVTADVVDGAAAASGATSAAATGGATRRLATARRIVGSLGATRASVQHLLRRFGFSDTPAGVTAAYRIGPDAWLAAQLDPAGIDDSQLAAYLQPIPVLTGDPTNDYQLDANIERRLIQRQIASKRQLLEKMVLHWMEHFSISQDKVYSSGAMARYEDTVRADALGNFATLVTDVSKEPAMLRWLDNNYNDGSHPASRPPNENFGRELMQLYVLGEDRLNADGTLALDATGAPIPNYGEPDVKTMALAFTGFQTYTPYPEPLGVDPRTFEIESFNPRAHASGPFTILGQRIADPGDATIVDRVVAMLVRRPTVAPFQVKELLQRFVTETPSPGYVARISAVWAADVDDPNQIAKVIAAIAHDPEFAAGAQTLLKEPIEFSTDAVRALGGAYATPVSATIAPFKLVRDDDGNMKQLPWYPPSVFSFYRPGDKESLVTNSALLARWQTAADLSNQAHVVALCTTCDTNLDLLHLAGASGHDIAQYLMDALVDGGTPELRALVETYVANDPHNIRGAIWLVMTSPEYEVD